MAPVYKPFTPPPSPQSYERPRVNEESPDHEDCSPLLQRLWFHFPRYGTLPTPSHVVPFFFLFLIWVSAPPFLVSALF